MCMCVPERRLSSSLIVLAIDVRFFPILSHGELEDDEQKTIFFQNKTRDFKARPTRMRFASVPVCSSRCVQVFAWTHRDGSQRNA